MAHKRSIFARAKLFYQQQQRFAPSISHFYREENDREISNPCSINPESFNYLRHRIYGTRGNFRNFHVFGSLFHSGRHVFPVQLGSSFARKISSSSVGEGATNEIEIMSDVADALANKTVEISSPLVNEVAVAAADSFFLVAALQYLVDYVHNLTGFNWWASIVVTMILIRWLQIPIMINQLKATSKFTLLRPKLEEIKQEMQNSDMSPDAIAEVEARTKELFNEYGITPYTPMKGLLVTDYKYGGKSSIF